MTLDRWIVHGNCLVGYSYNDKKFPSGTRIQTEAIRFIDLQNRKAECLDGKYDLKDPGTAEEHRIALIGKTLDAKDPKIDSNIFLNPRG